MDTVFGFVHGENNIVYGPEQCALFSEVGNILNFCGQNETPEVREVAIKAVAPYQEVEPGKCVYSGGREAKIMI